MQDHPSLTDRTLGTGHRLEPPVDEHRDAPLGLLVVDLGPGVLLGPHLAVPDRVPRRVPAVVAQDQVDLAAPGGEVELEAGPLVVVAVEADPDDVAAERLALAEPAAGTPVDLRMRCR